MELEGRSKAISLLWKNPSTPIFINLLSTSSSAICFLEHGHQSPQANSSCRQQLLLILVPATMDGYSKRRDRSIKFQVCPSRLERYHKVRLQYGKVDCTDLPIQELGENISFDQYNPCSKNKWQHAADKGFDAITINKANKKLSRSTTICSA